MHLRAAWEHNRLKADRSYIVRLLLNEQHKTKSIKKNQQNNKNPVFLQFPFPYMLHNTQEGQQMQQAGTYKRAVDKSIPQVIRLGDQ